MDAAPLPSLYFYPSSSLMPSCLLSLPPLSPLLCLPSPLLSPLTPSLSHPLSWTCVIFCLWVIHLAAEQQATPAVALSRLGDYKHLEKYCCLIRAFRSEKPHRIWMLPSAQSFSAIISSIKQLAGTRLSSDSRVCTL